MGRIHKLFLFLLVISNLFAFKIFSKNDQKQLFYEVNQIIIKGNEITKSKVIIRELAFKKNQQISQTEIEKKIEISNSNLTNLNLFNFITITHEIIENKINFTIDLVENGIYGHTQFLKFQSGTLMFGGMILKKVITETFQD